VVRDRYRDNQQGARDVTRSCLHTSMSRPDLKRAASSSPRTHDFSMSDSRSSLIGPNFLSDAEHQAQDREVVQRLKRLQQKRPFDPKDANDQGTVVSVVAQELGRNRGGCDLKPLLMPWNYADILSEDPRLMDIVGHSLTTNSYWGVRNFGGCCPSPSWYLSHRRCFPSFPPEQYSLYVRQSWWVQQQSFCPPNLPDRMFLQLQKDRRPNM
jgi:hypothetical protein